MSINTMTFVAPNLACGEARGGRIPQSGAVTDEQRRHRPNSAQPSGRQFFSGQTSLLAPHRSTSGYARRSRLVWPKNPFPRNVIIFMFMTTKLTAVDPNFNGRKWYCPPTFRESVDVAVSAANLQVAAAQATDPQVLL